MPVAEEEAHILLVEPASTLNTGSVRDERTIVKVDSVTASNQIFYEIPTIS